MLHARKVTKLFSVLLLLLLAPLGSGCKKAEDGGPANPGNQNPPPSGMDAAVTGTPDTGNGSMPVDAEFEPDVYRPPRDAAPPDPANITACRLFTTGTPMVVMGQPLFNSVAPPLALQATVYRVTVPARMSTHLNFALPTNGNYNVYINTAVSLTTFTIDGLQLDEESFRTRITECMEVKGRHAYTGMSAGNHVIRFGPVMAMPVTVDVVIVKEGT